MRKFLFIFYMFIGMCAVAQVDSSANNLLNELEGKGATPAIKKAGGGFFISAPY